MSGLSPTEEKFEEHIEAHLESVGYTSTHFSEYDRNLCLIKKQAIDFIQTTQPKQWSRLIEIHGIGAEHKVLSHISAEISSRGIIDVLRNQIIDRGVYLDLCYFTPNSDLNPDHLKLYQANQFTVVRQLHYSNRDEKSIDMVLFLNGLPIITMELKNQLTGQDIQHSENQYRNDRDPKEPFLKFKRCLAHFCVDNDKVSMTTRLSGKKTFFFPYNKGVENPHVEGAYRVQYLWKDILTPNSILDILENFIHVLEEKNLVFNEKTQKIDTKTKEILIFPRYHQLDLIRKFRRQLKEDGVGKSYLVQHTTGSGKSYSIGWLSHTLASFYRQQNDPKRMFDTIIVVTDRTVLDDQLRNTLQSLQKTKGVVSGVEKGSQELKEFLEQGKDIVVTTIQKFPFISETISSFKNKKFGVIIDEVHSSQSGELSKELKKSLSKTEDDEEFDYEDVLRQEIQSRGRQDHISFFGFTGTPKEKTMEVFGSQTPEGQFVPFHVYSMHQSIHEGFTLDVLQNYITYERYFKIKQLQGDGIKIPTSKGKRELIRYVDSHEMTVQRKVNIMLEHWISKGSKEIKGKSRGMIVTQSRKQCVRYFKEINRQLKERDLHYRCLIGFSGEVFLDDERWTESSLNLTVDHRGNVPRGLKNPKYRLLVVANKFQTGFDEPLVQSMYVDKKLDGVQCVQTLSRLNRTASGKTQSFVLDFVNKPDDIRKSFQRFYQATSLEEGTDPNRLYHAQRQIYDFHLYTHEDVNRFCEIFYDPQRDEGALHPILDKIVDKFKLIEDNDKREDFKSNVQSYIRMYGYLSQIINFSDIKLEKSFIFLKYLNKKLPKRESDRFNISNTINLDSLRIQKIHEHVEALVRENSVFAPPKFEGPKAQEPEYAFLSEIVTRVNDTYGINLTEEDKLGLLQVRQVLAEEPNMEKYMNGKNTENNKRRFFQEKFEGIMIDYYTANKLRFYKELSDNSAMKDLISEIIYSDYKKKIGTNEEIL